MCRWPLVVMTFAMCAASLWGCKKEPDAASAPPFSLLYQSEKDLRPWLEGKGVTIDRIYGRPIDANKLNVKATYMVYTPKGTYHCRLFGDAKGLETWVEDFERQYQDKPARRRSVLRHANAFCSLSPRRQARPAR